MFQIEPRTFVPYAIAVVLLIVVLRRAASSRHFKVERLWVLPALLALAAAALLTGTGVPGPVGIGVLALALAAGASVGWYRGRLTKVAIDPETHELTSQMSALGVMLVAALFFARYFIRTLTVYEPHQLAGAAPVSAATITDALTVFAVGAVCAQRIELWLRCRKLLAEAEAAGH